MGALLSWCKEMDVALAGARTQKKWLRDAATINNLNVGDYVEFISRSNTCEPGTHLEMVKHDAFVYIDKGAVGRVELKGTFSDVVSASVGDKSSRGDAHEKLLRKRWGRAMNMDNWDHNDFNKMFKQRLDARDEMLRENFEESDGMHLVVRWRTGRKPLEDDQWQADLWRDNGFPDQVDQPVTFFSYERFPEFRVSDGHGCNDLPALKQDEVEETNPNLEYTNASNGVATTGVETNPSLEYTNASTGAETNPNLDYTNARTLF